MRPWKRNNRLSQKGVSATPIPRRNCLKHRSLICADPAKPSTLATVTICPFPFSSMPGKNALIVQKWDKTLTPNVLKVYGFRQYTLQEDR